MNDENNLKNDSNDENVLNQNSDEPLDISEDTGMNQQGTVDEHEEYASPKKEAANAQGEEQTEQSQDSPSFNINVEGDATFADNIYHKNGKAKIKTNLLDPTIPFSLIDVSEDYNIEDEFITATKKFVNEAFVLIACDDHSIGIAAARQLNQYSASSEKRSTRKFSKQSIKNINTSITSAELEDNFSLIFLQNNFSNMPKNTTIIIDLTSEYSIEDARNFLSHLLNPKAQEGYFEDLKRQLIMYSLRIICLAPQKIMEMKAMKYRFHIWQINPIKILIYYHFPTEAEKLFKTISKQIELGKWGENPLDDVKNTINEKTFIQFIDQYAKQDENEEETDLKHFLALLKYNNSFSAITEAVLFTSLYFPKLSEPLFEEVLAVLLGDATIADYVKDKPIIGKPENKTGANIDESKHHAEKSFNITVKINDADITENKTDHPPPEMKQSDSAERHIEKEQSSGIELWNTDISQFALDKESGLIELWFKGARKIISHNTKITLINVPNGRSYIWFKKPHLSKAASEALKITDPFYFSKYFTKVLESGLVFHNSKFIADSALELIRQRMLLNPDLYDYRWLSSWVGKALIMLEIVQDVHPENIEEFDEQLRILASEPLLMERWTKLLKMMLGDEKLSKVTNEFLSNLFNIRQYERVLQFTVRLKDTPEFDIVYWLKRLIAESDEEVRQNSFHYLANFYHHNILQKPEIIETFLSWLPSNETEDNLPPLQQTALLIPLLSVVEAICDFDIETKVIPDTIFPLTITSGENNIELSKVFKSIMTILLHTRQGFDRESTQNILIRIAAKIFNEISTSASNSTKNKNDSSTNNTVILADHIVLLPIVQKSPIDILLSFILIAWAWQLLSCPKNSSEYKNAMVILDKICEEVVDKISKDRLINMRDFIRESRKLVSDCKSGVKQKDQRIILSKYISVSRQLANSLYQKRKERKK
jgi:hypothetical protein